MKLLHILVIFATLGLALARDFFQTLGIDASYPMIGAFGLAATTLLIFRGFLSLLAVAMLVVMVSLPQETLQGLNLDHDVLLAVVMTIVLLPWIKKIMQDA